MSNDTKKLAVALTAALILAHTAIGCGDSKSPEPTPVEKKEIAPLKGHANPAPAAPSAELVAKCKVFEPPWGAGNWIDWGQNNPEEGELWYNSIGDAMKSADFGILPQCKHLENVFVGMSSLTDLKPLAGLTGIKRLDLRFIEGLTDLKPLESLVNLEYLNISGTDVTDLTPLTKLPELKELEARTLKITDAAATAVAEMKALEKVDFLKVPLTDLTPMAQAPALKDILVCTTNIETLAPLVPVKDRVRGLDLCATRFEDYDKLAAFDKLTFLRLSSKSIADLSPLAGMTAMQRLDINGTKVKDLKPLAAMTEMKQLDLSELELKDLAPLLGMKKLEKVYLVKTQVSPDQVEQLKKALPNAQVLDEYEI